MKIRDLWFDGEWHISLTEDGNLTVSKTDFADDGKHELVFDADQCAEDTLAHAFLDWIMDNARKGGVTVDELRR